MVAQEVWQPPLHQRGAEICNDKHRYLLVAGAKKTAKTISICQKAAIHLYDYDHSHVGLVVKRQENARTGVWPDMTSFVTENIWQETASALHYHLKPRVTPETKRRIFSVYNRHGGVSNCTLVTAYRASEIEEVLKNTRFSFIYINEADQFPETIFSAAADQLRLTHMGIPEAAHQLVLDCNPPTEGEKHWLYRRFIDTEGKDANWFRDHHVIKTFIADNPWLSRREIDDLVSRYRSSPRLYARYVDGIWVPSSEGSLFEEIFREEQHVVGESLAGKPQSSWNILLPPRHTNQLICGWDLGDVNHSMVILSKRWHPDGYYCYDILEDVTSMAREMSIRQFTKKALVRLEYWWDILKRREAELVSTHHWSDPTAFLTKSMGARGSNTHALEVKNASNGRIILRPVRKGPGSVAARVSMMENLLMDNRIYISILATNVINAMIGLKPSPNGIARAPMLIHAFDALTYAISGEIGKDLREENEEEKDSGQHQFRAVR